jgi:elongation factor P--beta-lysine ligase
MSDYFTARVLHMGNSERVTLITGTREFEMPWPDAPLALGDVFLMEPGDPPHIIKKIGGAVPDGWNHEGDAMRWRKRGADGKTRMDVLWQRHTIRRAVRDYLDNEGFIQLDCPLLVRGTTPDAAINSFSVGDRYLSTSTELQMRRLEVGGFEKLYTLTQNFRAADGEGSTHNPEFTMLEWVRVGAELDDIERDTEQLVWYAHQALDGGKVLESGKHRVRLEPPWERITMAEAITKFTGAPMPDFSLASIQNAVAAADLMVHKDWHADKSFLFSILVDHLQKFLGFERPVFVRDWPAFQTSSAQQKEGVEITDRSEAYICGLELCNGFVSLADYEGQKIAFQQQLERRVVEGKLPVELDHAYLDALRLGMPCDSAMALGFDRLVMLLTGQTEIRQTLALAWDEL